MEYLISDKERYAAAIIVEGYCSNVEYALRESDNMINGVLNPLTHENRYYMLYNPTWKIPYIIKKQRADYPDIINDHNILRLKF